MKREFLQDFYHVALNYVDVVKGIALKLKKLKTNPIKNRDDIDELISCLLHRTEKLEIHCKKFYSQVKDQDEKIKKIINGDDNA